MGTRSFIIAGIAVVVLLVCSGAVYAYDHSHRDVIAHGVRIAGIDVGGLTAAQARARLQREYLPRLRQPLVARFHSHRFVLGPKAAHLKVDIDGAVDQAVSRSRDGMVLVRVWRSLTDGDVNVDLQPQATFSEAAVRRLAARVTRTLDRPARDATLSFTPDSLQKVPARAGLAVNRPAFVHAVENVLEHPTAGHAINVPASQTAPKVTTSQLANRYPAAITIDRGRFTLRVYQHLHLTRTYPIAVGMQGLSTPAGLYHIQNKVINPSWDVPNSPWAGSLAGQVIPPGPQDPLKARWMGLWNGAGIHGTDETGSIGHAFSHGCVRMLIPDVIDLYARVQVGTPVYIGD